MATDGFWEFKGWIRVPGTAEDKAAAERAAETFAEEASAGENGSISIEDSEPIFEGDE